MSYEALDAFGNQAAQSKPSILEILNDIKIRLPIQNPISFFVHNNPLQFWETQSFQNGIIDAVALYENALEKKGVFPWRALEDFVLPILGSYMDQGLSRWNSLIAKEGLWGWYCSYVHDSANFRSPILRFLKSEYSFFISKPPIDIIEKKLNEIFPDSKDWKPFLQTLIFHFKGWSGMIHLLQKDPRLFPLQPREVQFIDWVCILVCTASALVEEGATPQEKKYRIWDSKNWNLRRQFIGHELQKLSDDEFTHHLIHLTQLKGHLNKILLSRESGNSLVSKREGTLFLFCIDDREESLRRHLEERDSDFFTFGTVGFFGIDFTLRKKDHLIYQPQCPPVIQPKKKASEVALVTNHILEKCKNLFYSIMTESRFSFLEPLYALLLWPIYGFFLFLRAFNPLYYHHVRALLRYDRSTRLQFELSYTLMEKSEIVYQVLLDSGITEIHTPFVLIVSHGATTTNNPMQKSYGCGACSGQSGFPNAKLFVQFANDIFVRNLVGQKGLNINPDTVFIAANHDTSADTMDYDKPKLINEQQEKEFEIIIGKVNGALMENKKERWLQFSLSSFESAARRAHDWSQPRPEFGHTGVSMAIIGPRNLSRGFDLHRQAFLVSYEPQNDPKGEMLIRHFQNALPVCANINLDYFTSSAFRKALGSGSKLPLNISAGIGLMTGSKSDLRIGLATQMIDQHTPMRLLTYVCAGEEQLNLALSACPRVKQLVSNNWIHLLRIDPTTLEIIPVSSEMKKGIQNELASL